MSKVVYEELPNYTKEELLADIGGALGLILGLNVLDVLVFSGALIKRISFALGYLCRFGHTNYCKLHRLVSFDLLQFKVHNFSAKGAINFLACRQLEQALHYNECNASNEAIRKNTKLRKRLKVHTQST